MDKSTTYKKLADKFVKYSDLKCISVAENRDAFANLPSTQLHQFGVVGCYGALTDMKIEFPLIPVRREVKIKLDRADQRLKQIDSNLQLVVSYGYRSIEVQKKYFEAQKKKRLENGNFEGENIDEIIHRSIAVPTVAGHPTGGAVDVYVKKCDDNEILDFGVPIYAIDSEDAYTFSPFISKKAQINRELLRKVMMSQNFAPFDGEWWHFSYGDREWAYYYQKSAAIYDQMSDEYVLKLLKLNNVKN